MDVPRLPPTSADLDRGDRVPYFLFWTDVSADRLRELLRSDDLDVRAYWLGAVLREANTRDVWLFTTPAEIRAMWPRLVRHLGRSRAMWAFLLGVDAEQWPPREARRGS
jgi:hypothetical protein